MRVPALLGNVPNIAYGVRLRSKAKRGLGDQVDNLVSGKEIAGVEIDSTIAFPDDNLPDRKARYDLTPVLEKPALDPPLVVVENRPVFA